MQDAKENAPAQAQEAKKTHPRREELKALSAVAKMAVKEGIANSVNEYLIELYTKQQGDDVDFHTLYDWNNKGFSIKKGSRAFVIWGRPKGKKAEAQAQAPANGEEQDEYKFYPLCYLFSSNQVQPTAKKGKP